MKEKLSTESKWDAFGNLKSAALFETKLAHAILKFAPHDILRDINHSIIKYLKHIRNSGVGEQIRVLIQDQLLKYKFIKKTDVTSTFDSYEKLIYLLERSLDNTHYISECFTLHLMFFNYQHIFRPELLTEYKDVDPETVRQERDDIHRKLRDKGQYGLFNRQVRGRLEKQYKKRHRAAGITDTEGEALLEEELRLFNQDQHTPYKYRVHVSEESPIVKKFRKVGIPYIAGPSGTAADCLEGLYFLIPKMNVMEKKSYFNLMAAAEVMQGHHSLHEVMLTACYAKALPDLLEEESEKPIWESIDYRHSYQNFLGDSFKETQAYKNIQCEYPQYLVLISDQKKVDQGRLSHLLKEIAPFQSLMMQAQRKWRSDYAAREMRKGDYWKSISAPTDQNFIQWQSKVNIQGIRQKLGELKDYEKKFISIFSQFDFQITHYTKHARDIQKSGRLFSAIRLQEISPHIKNNSMKDIETLKNGNYVFFRFEVKHLKSKASRFGHQQLVFDARESGLFQTGWISMFEMLNPHSASVAKKVVYKGKVVREAILTEDSNKVMCFQYSKEEDVFNVPGTVFYGSDIILGIALTILRELRRIGGDMQRDFTEQLRVSDDPGQLLEPINALLSKLFRPEAKIPAAVYLKNQTCTLYNPFTVKMAIQQDNLELVKQLLPLEEVNALLPRDEKMEAIYPLSCAAKSDSATVMSWLIKEGAKPESSLIQLASEGALHALNKLKKLYLSTGLFSQASPLSNPLQILFFLVDGGIENPDDLRKIFGEAKQSMSSLNTISVSTVNNELKKTAESENTYYTCIRVLQKNNHLTIKNVRKIINSPDPRVTLGLYYLKTALKKSICETSQTSHKSRVARYFLKLIDSGSVNSLSRFEYMFRTVVHVMSYYPGRVRYFTRLPLPSTYVVAKNYFECIHYDILKNTASLSSIVISHHASSSHSQFMAYAVLTKKLPYLFFSSANELEDESHLQVTCHSTPLDF